MSFENELVPLNDHIAMIVAVVAAAAALLLPMKLVGLIVIRVVVKVDLYL